MKYKFKVKLTGIMEDNYILFQTIKSQINYYFKTVNLTGTHEFYNSY